MFPRKFVVDHKYDYSTHEFGVFISDRPQEEVVKEIMTSGIAKFMTDRNILLNVAQSCCSGTKYSSYWYIYPIHKSALANVGLTEQELIQWLNFLNSSRAGFKYYYFGEQPINKANADRVSVRRYGNGQFYWVAVPCFDHTKNANQHFSYLHWIFLRYLISTLTSGFSHNRKMYVDPYYYMIPRVAIMLHEDYKVPKLKALLYAHLTAPYFDYKAMTANSAFWGNSKAYNQSFPDVGMLPAQFKKIWYTYSGVSMNTLFTPYNSANHPQIAAIRQMRAPYEPQIAAALFAEGKVKEFIKYLKDSYRVKKEKKDVKEKVVA